MEYCRDFHGELCNTKKVSFVGCKVFRIYPEGRHLRYDVFIHDTKKEMHLWQFPIKPDFRAIVNEHTIYRNGKRKRMVALRTIGEIHFYRRQIGAYVVSHELLHAALGWARKIKLDFNPIMLRDGGFAHPNEEALCEVHGRLMQQFVKKCVELGLYPEA